jgi:hypothetical protein
MFRVGQICEWSQRPRHGHFFFDVNNSLEFERYWTCTVWFEKPSMAIAPSPVGLAVMAGAHDARP